MIKVNKFNLKEVKKMKKCVEKRTMDDFTDMAGKLRQAECELKPLYQDGNVIINEKKLKKLSDKIDAFYTRVYQYEQFEETNAICDKA